MPIISFFIFLILPLAVLSEVARGRNKEIRTRSITWQQLLPILIHLIHHPILSLLLSMEGWDQRTRRLGHSVYVESGPLVVSDSAPLYTQVWGGKTQEAWDKWRAGHCKDRGRGWQKSGKAGGCKTYQDQILDHLFQSFSSLDKMVYGISNRSGNTRDHLLLRMDRGLESRWIFNQHFSFLLSHSHSHPHSPSSKWRESSNQGRRDKRGR